MNGTTYFVIVVVLIFSFLIYQIGVRKNIKYLFLTKTQTVEDVNKFCKIVAIDYFGLMIFFLLYELLNLWELLGSTPYLLALSLNGLILITIRRRFIKDSFKYDRSKN